MEERLKAYMDLYDIVVVSDETMDVAIAVLKQILWYKINKSRVTKMDAFFKN